MYLDDNNYINEKSCIKDNNYKKYPN